MKLPSSFSATDWQKEIYLKGISGQRPLVPIDFKKLEASARKKLSPTAYSYIAGGAGLGKTMKQNRKAFENWQIVPRMLRDVSSRDVSIKLFNSQLPAPLLLSPVGVLDLAHPEADLAVAKGAASVGIPVIFSNQASTPIEQCSAEMNDSPRWFQLYWSKSNELVKSFLSRAERSGCSAIVVTLDTTLLGWRLPDLDLAYLPFIQGRGIAQYVSDPIFQQLIDAPDAQDAPPPKRKVNFKTLTSVFQLMSNYPGSFFDNLRSRRPLRAVQKFINIYSRPSLNWEDLSWLRRQTSLPILLKGILHHEDARKALNYEIDGIIVSNHGGRQIDGAISSIEALPAIVKSVEGQIPIILDSGVRTGADIFKALALGAAAVSIGRPYVYALALGGEKGVTHLIKNILSDFELTMSLAGARSVDEIDSSYLSSK